VLKNSNYISNTFKIYSRNDSDGSNAAMGGDRAVPGFGYLGVGLAPDSFSNSLLRQPTKNQEDMKTRRQGRHIDLTLESLQDLRIRSPSFQLLLH